MEVKIVSQDMKDVGKQKLPGQFDEIVRPDLIKKAVLASQANARQPYGSKPGAGMRQSGELSRRRRKYRGGYGKGISRVPRKILVRRGMQMIWVGTNVPGTVGGRKAHSPEADKVWEQKMNVKERRKALRSALAATMDKSVVEERGHKVPERFPFIVDSAVEKVSKTKDLETVFNTLGFANDLKRSSNKTVRAGIGKRRGRKYKRAKGPLLVVSSKCEAVKAAKNVPGVDVSVIDDINTELLAPGCDPGRLTLFTKAAIERLEKEQLFM